ncbi:MAG TPA: tetratricopeptide repeat protein, partial [Nannocystaceae bacterium]|nr:tetratricopeptide repeat protein [Nannocystaceae bacterium]
ADLRRVIADEQQSSARRIDALLDAATVEDWCEDYEQAESLVGGARQLVGSDADPLHAARLALARGRVDFRKSRIDEAIAELTLAAELAEALGDAGYETRVISLLLLAPLLGMTGHADRSLPLFDTLFALCREHSDRIHLATALLNRPFVWIETQQFDKLREDLEHVIAMSRTVGFPLLEARARYNLGEIAYLQGEFDEAERHTSTVIELERELGGDNQRVLVTQLLTARSRARRGEIAEARAIVAAIRDRQAEARAAVRTGFELMPSDEVLCRMVELSCDGGDTDAWAELLARSEEDSVQQEHIEVLELAGLAAARRGANDEAYCTLARALALTDTTPTMLRPRIEAALREIASRRAAG